MSIASKWSPQARARIAVTLLMLIWGNTFLVTKSAVTELSPLVAAALRYIIATAVLVPVALMRGGLGNLPSPRPYAMLFALGLIGVTLYYTFFNLALMYGTASQGALVQALLPASIALSAVIGLKEKLSRRRIAGIMLSIAGVALLVGAGASTDDLAAPDPLLGGLLMIAAVVCWGVYTSLAKRLAHADLVIVTVWISFIGMLMLLPFAAYELHSAPLPRVSLQAWLGLIYLGVVASALGFIIYNRVLRDLDASEVGVYVNLVPIVGVMSAMLFLGETLQPAQFVGGAIALAGMWLAS